jgi:hypothetical protein
VTAPDEASKEYWRQVLTAPAAGEVAELGAGPGTAVEPGTLLLRLTDVRRPLVRLDLPPEVLGQGAPAQVELEPCGTTAGGRRAAPPRVRARLVGAAPEVDVVSQYAGYFYEVIPPESPARPDGLAWRPGLFVKGDLAGEPEAGTKPQPAVSVPAGAVLYHEGRALVYVVEERTEETTRYVRCEVRVLGRQDGRCVLVERPTVAGPGRLMAGAQVVVIGTQFLLSQEFKGSADAD